MTTTSADSVRNSRSHRIIWVRTGLTIAVLFGCGLFAYASRLRLNQPEPQVEINHWQAVIKGRTLLQQNRPDLALEVVADIRDEGPGAGEAMGVAGVALARMGKIRTSRSALERALALQPNQPLVVRTLAALDLALGETDRALELLKKATELSPRDPRPWFAMGKVYLDMGLANEARVSFEETLKRDDGLPDARLGLIEAMLTSGHAESAGKIISKALRVDPLSPKLLGLAAHQARDMGEKDEAMAFANRALELDPEDIEALLIRARLRHSGGERAAALVDAEKAALKNPNLLAALNLKMQLESALGLTDRADDTGSAIKRLTDRLALMEGLTKQIESHPNDAEPRWKLGRIAAEGGQNTLAANCYRAALALDPECQPARAGLSTLEDRSRAGTVISTEQ